MSQQRFIARDIRQALQQIKQTLGEDAVILSNRSVAEGVEIMACAAAELEALSRSVPKPSPNDRQTPARRLPPRSTAHRETRMPSTPVSRQEQKLKQQLGDEFSYRSPVTENPEKSPQLQELMAMINALQASQQELLKQFEQSRLRDTGGPSPEMPSARTQHNPPAESSRQEQLIQRRLEKAGFAQAHIRQLLDQSASYHCSAEQRWQGIKKAMMKQLDCLPGKSTPILDGGVHAMVGPTGAGKTTTIGKLAARYVLAHGPDSVALVSTDNYRIGGHQQIENIGRILDVPVYFVDQKQNLDELLLQLSSHSLVLVDTAGLAPHDEHWTHQYQSLSSVRHTVQHWLLLPATCHEQVLAQWVASWQSLKLSGAILTKLDEAVSMGAALSCVMAHHLPVSWYTHGQTIPDDISRAATAGLLKMALTDPAIRQARGITTNGKTGQKKRQATA